MANQKKWTWLWIAAVLTMLGLFGPSVLVATDGSSDDFSDFETFQECFGTSQSSS